MKYDKYIAIESPTESEDRGKTSEAIKEAFKGTLGCILVGFHCRGRSSNTCNARSLATLPNTTSLWGQRK